MTEHVKENKTKAELIIEINNLKKQINDNNEHLIELGIIQKETFMSRIEALEENTLKNIDNLIAACVSETGRDFPWIILNRKSFNSLSKKSRI